MDSKVNTKELQTLLNNKSVLYVEDNKSLAEKATKFFKKFFNEVYQAKNGQDGLDMFKKYHPEVVVTDIEMPVLDGIEMSSNIRDMDKNVKIIITSAYDNKDYLLKTINIGIAGYMIKPIAIDNMLQVLEKVAKDLEDKNDNNHSFQEYLDKAFNTQDNILFVIENEHVVLVNDTALDFFGLKTLDQFREKFKEFGSLLLPQDNFLFESKGNNYLEELKNNKGKFFNVKMLNKDGKLHHLLLKLLPIPDKKNFYVISLNDVTELNILSLYDNSSLSDVKILDDKKSIINILKATMQSNAKIELYNLYKGLSIIHDSKIISIDKDKIVMQTAHIQLKAADLEQKTILTSELFPHDIEFRDVKRVDYKKQTIEIDKPTMIMSSPTKRKYITLDPDPDYIITLFYNERIFETEISIINISVNSMRLNMEYVPAGFKVDDTVSVDIVFNDTKERLIINSDAKVFKIIKNEDHFEVVIILEQDKSIEKKLVNYISKRQMKLIRKFKGIDNG